MAYYAAVDGHFGGVTGISSLRRGLGPLFVDVRLLEINSPLPQVIEQLNRFQPELLAGYTTGLKILAEQQQARLLRIAPIRVLTGGEAMSRADKELLETAFKCEAANGYGATELGIQGGSNPDGETMTLYDDDLIYEFFDDHSLATNLFNFTQPLIRYRMSDILQPIVRQNPGSPYIVIKGLVGRAEKVPTFVSRNGAMDFIHPISVVELFIPGVTRFQMRLVDKQSFIFAVVLDRGLNVEQRGHSIAATRTRLCEFLSQKLMDNVNFEVVPVDDLPVNPRTGKFQLIVDA